MNTRSMPRPGLRPAPSHPAQVDAPAAAPRKQGRWTSRPWWPWVRRAASLLFFAVVGWLLFKYGHRIDWGDVWASLRNLPLPALLAAVGLAVASHLLYSCFDLIGRRYTGHNLRTGIVMPVNFISYAFNLNFGSLVGAVAFRYRLYSRLGLDNGTITQVLTLSMLTNWLGYLVLAGTVFTMAPLELPPTWKMDSQGLRWLGMGLLALAALYLGLCVWSKKRSFSIRGHDLMLPRPRMVAVQLGLSCANWLVMGGIIFVLLQGKLPYPTVLSVLLVAAVAGVVTHVPAGLGVLEAVFVTLLSHRISEGQLLAALLGYRAVYYIGPLVIAALMYLAMEVRVRRLRRKATLPT